MGTTTLPIAIVGGGPAGLDAARAGLIVHLYDQRPSPERGALNRRRQRPMHRPGTPDVASASGRSFVTSREA